MRYRKIYNFGKLKRSRDKREHWGIYMKFFITQELLDQFNRIDAGAVCKLINQGMQSELKFRPNS